MSREFRRNVRGGILSTLIGLLLAVLVFVFIVIPYALHGLSGGLLP